MVQLFTLDTFAQADSFVCQKTISNSSNEVISKVEANYQVIENFKADFIQQSYFIGADEWQESKGSIGYKRPGKMNWQYLAPDEQEFVSDGKIIFWYQPKEKQVMIRNLNSSFSSEVPLSFLLGVGKLTKDFKLENTCESDTGFILKLIPNIKSDSLNEFYLLVEKSNYFPKGARIIDSGGNETKIQFFKVDTTVKLNDSLFKFDAPKGTDIIDQREEESREE